MKVRKHTSYTFMRSSLQSCDAKRLAVNEGLQFKIPALLTEQQETQAPKGVVTEQ